MKKVSMLIVFCMVLALVAPMAFAQQSATVSAGHYSANEGQVFTVSIDVVGGKTLGMAGAEFIFNFDPEVVEVNQVDGEDDINLGPIWRTGINAPSIAANVQADNIHFAIGGPRDILADGALFTIGFKVIGDPGDVGAFTFAEASLTGVDADEELYEMDSVWVVGSVTVPDPVADATAAVNALFNEDGTLKDDVTLQQVRSALALVNALAASAEKTALLALLAPAYVEVLFNADGTLAAGVTQADIDAALALVNALPDGAEKTALLAELAEAQELLPVDDEDADDDADEDAKLPATGSQALPFILIGALLAIIAVVMIVPARRIRKQQ